MNKEFIRFYNKVQKTEYCWEWKASTRSGYGAFKLNNKVYGAHRVSYVFASGKIIPDDKVIMHICDNRLCVNPEHLKLTIQKENVQDAVMKNIQYDISKHSSTRFKPGLEHPYAKLSEEDKKEILSLVQKGLSYREIGNKYNIDHSRVYQIIKNK